MTVAVKRTVRSGKTTMHYQVGPGGKPFGNVLIVSDVGRTIGGETLVDTIEVPIADLLDCLPEMEV